MALDNPEPSAEVSRSCNMYCRWAEQYGVASCADGPAEAVLDIDFAADILADSSVEAQHLSSQQLPAGLRIGTVLADRNAAEGTVPDSLAVRTQTGRDTASTHVP